MSPTAEEIIEIERVIQMVVAPPLPPNAKSVAEWLEIIRRREPQLTEGALRKRLNTLYREGKLLGRKGRSASGQQTWFYWAAPAPTETPDQSASEGT